MRSYRIVKKIIELEQKMREWADDNNQNSRTDFLEALEGVRLSTYRKMEFYDSLKVYSRLIQRYGYDRVTAVGFSKRYEKASHPLNL